MTKFFYPALFRQESSGYSVVVPDLDGCYSQGENMEEACEMVFDAIGLYLEGRQESDYPQPSSLVQIQTAPDEVLVLIPFDNKAYERKWNTKSVRKSLTIPQWLNEEAERHHINYSKILQDALKKELYVHEK